jgi:hypothetical protein
MEDCQSKPSPEEITPHDALLFVDNALHKTLGQRLNDLESSIFIGSWEGKTYEEIYPPNPEYIEKSVGYKLWKKLSIALGEKVSKKRIRGAVMRHYRDVESLSCFADRPAGGGKCAIIWQAKLSSTDQALMPTLSNCLKGLGYSVYSSLSEYQAAGLTAPPHHEFAWLSRLPCADVLVVTFSSDGAAVEAPGH